MTLSGKSKVLIAGGGVAALEAALALRALAEDRASIELLAPETSFWYRPLAVAAPFRLGAVQHFELDGLALSIEAGFTPGALVAIDAWRHVVHTSQNTDVPYDFLLIACGAVPAPAVSGALTFRGPADVEKLEDLLEEIELGDVRSVAFAIPWGAVWSLPAYELALLTAGHLEQRKLDGIELTLVTPEEEPLQVFGPPASKAIRELLAERDIALRTGAYASEARDGELRLIPEGAVAADRVVALPRLRGAPIDGVPQTVDGFIPVDAHGRVHHVEDIFAAGDITSFTVKQGGIATQQADAAAETIAAALGAEIDPAPFRPVLRGFLLTGREPRYLRREMTADPEEEPAASYDALWWPPAKIVGRYLAPFLASLAGVEETLDFEPRIPGTVAVVRELEPRILEDLESSRLPSAAELHDERIKVEEVMSAKLLVVAPEDTLGEVAERMLSEGERVALVCEYGRLAGILDSSDLLRAAAARVHPSEARVRLWMTAEPVTVSSQTPLGFAETIMREFGVDQVPVVDDDRPIGMLHLADATTGVPLHVGLGF